MNHLLKKSAAAFSLFFCLISTVSCGEKKAASTSANGKLKPRPKTVDYAPTDEIKNAPLSSGLIQIGNDVFRNGGYYTVGQLMEKLEGKYELQGGIDIDGVLVGDEEKVGIYLPKDVQISDDGIPAYDIAVYYSNLNAKEGDETPVKDAIVYQIYPNLINYDVFDSVWQPGGIKAFPAEIGLSEIVDTYEKNSLEKVDSEHLYNDCSSNHKYNVYTEHNKFGRPNELQANAMICGTEANLYGVCPIYCYEFTYNENSKKGLSFQWNEEYSTFIEDDENTTDQ